MIFYLIFLAISSRTIRRNAKTSLRKNNDKCFEYELIKKSNLNNTLNLINLFAYHQALNKTETKYISFHQKTGKNGIFKREITIQENEENITNDTIISVYLLNKYNVQVIYFFQINVIE